MNNIEIELEYSKFKEICQSKRIRMQYYEDDQRYYIFAWDFPIIYKTSIYKADPQLVNFDWQPESQNLSDFETNYKASSNRPLILSPVEADSKFVGKYIKLGINQTEAYCEWSFDKDVEVRKILSRPFNAAFADRVELSAWTKPGVMGQDPVKVRDFGIIYLRGGDGFCGNWYEGIGTGKLPSYCTLRCYYYRENSLSEEREFYIDVEFIV